MKENSPTSATFTPDIDDIDSAMMRRSPSEAKLRACDLCNAPDAMTQEGSLWICSDARSCHLRIVAERSTDYATEAFTEAMFRRIRWMQAQDAQVQRGGRFTAAIEELSTVLLAFYRNAPEEIERNVRDYTGLTSNAHRLDDARAKQKRSDGQ